MNSNDQISLVEDNQIKKPTRKFSLLDIEKPLSSHNEKIFGERIVLNTGITKINYICSLLHFLTMLFSFLITDTLQPMILLDPHYFNIDKETSGELIAKILVILLVFKIFISPFYGYCIDRFGRVIMLRYAAINILLGYLSVPYQKSVFPGFLISKILFSNGGTIYALVPFNADYVHDSSKGKAAGLQLTLGTVGGLLGALFVKMLLWLGFDLSQCYIISGFIVFTSTMLYSFGLKPGNKYYYKLSSAGLKENVAEQPITQKFMLAWTEVKNSPWIMIAVLLTIVGNADFYILTVLFALYVKSFFGSTDADALTSNHLISFWQLTAFTLAAIFNIISGHFIDKINPIKIIVPSVLLTIIGFFFSLLVQSPYDTFFMILVILPSISLPAIYTTANYLAIKHFPQDMRGTLSSFVGMVGYLGYVFIALFGGILFDRVHRSGPYVLYSLMLTMALFIILRIYNKNIVNKRERLPVECFDK